MVLQRLDTEWVRWSKGALSFNVAATPAELSTLETAIGRPLPQAYRDILERFNGADLHGERLFSVAEVLGSLAAFNALLEKHYNNDPDWSSGSRASQLLLPIGDDTYGNVKCLELLSGEADVVNCDHETRELTSVYRTPAAWLATRLAVLSARFDYNGRPRTIKGGEREPMELSEVLVHLEIEPDASVPLLALAHWYEQNGTPEEALFAYRSASEGTPKRAISYYYWGRWALLQGRYSEARQAFRRAVSIPGAQNPLKHRFKEGYLPAAHKLLALLYERVGQGKKAVEQHIASDKAEKRYGFGWYESTADYQEALRALKS